MNELDFLAWLILGVFVVFGVLPSLLGGRWDSYGTSLAYSFMFVITIGVVAVVGGALVWALHRVLG